MVARILFLKAHLVGLHTKVYFKEVLLPITQNVRHCNGRPLLGIMSNVFSDSLYVVIALY